jgi:tetratricopeptide (TPR) repeat protein
MAEATTPVERAARALMRAERLLLAGQLEEARPAGEALGAFPELSAHAQHLLGRIERARGDPEAAARHFRGAIAADGAVAAVHRDLGNALQDQGRLEPAIAAYREALRLQPGSAETHNDLGTALFARGRLEEAEACYRNAIRLQPSHAVAHENLGALLRQQGRIAEARRSLQRALGWRVAAWWRERLAAVAFGRWFLGRRRRERQEMVEAAEGYAREGNLRVAATLAEGAGAAAGTDARALRRLAACEERIGRRERALALLRRVVESDRADPRPRVELGRLLLRSGVPHEAEEVLRRALALRPGDAAAQLTLGHVLIERGDLEGARRAFEGLVRAKPRSAEAHYGLGRALFSGSRRAEAEASFRRALELDPRHVGARAAVGDLLRLRARFEEAREAYEAALAVDPSSEEASIGLALSLFALGEREETLGILRRLIRANPRSARLHRHLGGVLRDSAATEEAIPVLREALRLDPKDADAMRFLGSALGDLGRYGEARAMFEAALAGAPHRADLWNEMGIFEMYAGRTEAAERCLRQAIELGPELPAHHNNLGHCLIIQGRLEEGWALLDHRGGLAGHAEGHQRFALPRWEGEPLGGRSILVYAEQGLGDEIMFASCIPDLARAAGRCIAECDPRLAEIFARSFPGVEVQASKRWDAGEWFERLQPKPELQVAAGSLPRYFRRRLEDFPRHSGYLQADPARVERWRSRLAQLGAKLCVGISWKGGLVRTGEMRRTLKLERLLPILRQPGVVFVSLQYTESRADLLRLEREHGIRVHHWQEAIADYENTAALACALDGVISVCTALVHLCGALGRPVWVLAPHNPGFRYRIGERNPWYPGVELFEQSVPGEWDPVLAAVRQRLAAAVARREFHSN